MSPERAMRTMLRAAVILVFAVSLQAQSLVEVSRREKARRESLKGRLPVVVTNKDLAAVRRAPAVSPSVSEQAPEGVLPDGSDGPQGPKGVPAKPAPPSGGRRLMPRVAPSGPSLVGDDGSPGGVSAGDLESRLRAAREAVDLLTTKMNALRQKFYRNDDMTPLYIIERQIAETYDQIEQARETESKLLEEIEKREAADDKRRREHDSGPR
jgi:hypothetical protein